MAITDGIIGCWSPSVRGAGLLLPDLARGNHAVITLADPSSMWKAATIYGKAGRVYELDGSDDNVAITCNLPSQAFSLAMWIYPIGTYFAPYVFGSQAFSLSMNGSTFSNAMVMVRGGSSSQTANNTSPPSNQWAFVTATLRAGRAEPASITLNGRPVALTTQGITTDVAVTSMRIGSRIDGFGRNQARYGEVTVWSGRAITDAEAAEMWRQGNGAIGRQLTGQTRRRTYGFVQAGFRPYWARRQSQIIGGGT
jgi:hypothetical protein